VTKLIDRLRRRSRQQAGARESLFQALQKAQAWREAARQPDAKATESRSEEVASPDEAGDDGEVSRTDA
jgi:hypothetical protein